jgi:two-component system CheB/CheR fusion protein
MMDEPQPPVKDAPVSRKPGHPDGQADSEGAPGLKFPVVGIGASAGGLEAFIEFFEAFPTDNEMAFVLVQHLPPEHESMLVDILRRKTALPVLQVEDGMPILRHHIYVICPGRTLTIRDGHFHLGQPVEKRGHRRPVDDFFRSLAAEQRERAICIVMSGMGSNGTAGAQAIKAAGGICIAQDPASAKYPMMPHSLIEAGLADFIMPVGEMPRLLARYGRRTDARNTGGAVAPGGNDRQALQEILILLRARLHLDFSGYKKPTLVRRIQRRMGVNQITVLADYVQLVRHNPGEISALAEDMMIHVTAFFRDPEAWEALREKVIQPMMAGRSEDAEIRAWVVACSTGEEAYTLAMLFVEAMEAAEKNIPVKIFATDTSEQSLSHARSGIYPDGIESDISAARLERFFDYDGSVYRIKKKLRERVVFAPQNLLQYPPFSRLDLCTCRNLLIYLEPKVQQHALSLLHFSLRERGVLMLGTSEIVSGSEELYETIDRRHRIYRRTGPVRPGIVDLSLPPAMTPAGDWANVGSRSPLAPRISLAQLTQQSLLTRYVPAAVVIDRRQRIVYFHGATGKYLDQPRGEPTRELIQLVREPLRGAVRTALQNALKNNAPALGRGGIQETTAGRVRIGVAVHPLDVSGGASHFVIAFLEQPEPAASAAPLDPDAGDRTAVRLLEEELQRTRDELQSAIGELQMNNEEMKAANEETTSVNEEMQSTNEELETSKEELQSLNEELTAVNAQLQSKMEELQNATNDLSSLLSSTSIGVIFLDPHFHIRRFTPTVRDLIELISSDVGRPLSDLAWKFTDASLLADARLALDRKVLQEKEVTSESGRIYMRRILPYRTADDHVEGVVITFIDISDRKHAETELRLQDARSRLILDGLTEYAIFLLDTDGRIMTWAKGAERVLGFTAAEAIGQSLAIAFTPEGRAAGLAETKLRQARETGGVSEDYWHARKDGSRFWGTGVLYPLRDDHGTPLGFVKILRDNTERKRAEDALREAKHAAEEANAAKDQFLATVSHELRTPLSAMLLWAKMLSEDDEELTPSQLAEGLQAIKKCAEEQCALIEDIVDTSRIVAGKLRLDPRAVALADVLHSAVKTILPVARAKGEQLKQELDEAAGVVRADPHRLQQAFGNLLANAVKFTPAGGFVNVRLRRTGAEVELIVVDTGQGIGAALLPRIFDRFRQAEDTTTRVHSGLGLGLAIAKQLVELHGGTIVAESAGPGLGATFTVRLPLPALDPQTLPDASGPLPAGEESSLENLRVLLVEDAPETRKAVTTLLRRAGATVTAATSAAAAVSLFEHNRPDVILSDIGLPGTNGHDFLRQIRRLEKEQNHAPVPAIALTAYADEDNRGKALESGFQKCLTKPVDVAQLQLALAKFKSDG